MKEVAPVVVHESVEELPEVTDVGEAVSVQVGAEGGGGITVIVVLHVVSPPGPITVMV